MADVDQAYEAMATHTVAVVKALIARQSSGATIISDAPDTNSSSNDNTVVSLDEYNRRLSQNTRRLAYSNQQHRQGMDVITGRLIAPVAHLKQSITDILLTAIGTRVMRRKYGSDLYLLKDKRMTPENITRIYAAVAKALQRWEPRVVLDRALVSAHDADQGLLEITLQWRITKRYRQQFGYNVNDNELHTQRLEVA